MLPSTMPITVASLPMSGGAALVALAMMEAADAGGGLP